MPQKESIVPGTTPPQAKVNGTHRNGSGAAPAKQVSFTLNGKSVVEGADSSYRTTSGYDEVTGLGTPWLPALIDALLFY